MKILFPENDIEAAAKEGDTLLDIIRTAGLPIEALCSGRGTCGKCRVSVNGVETLACKTLAEDGMRVDILSSSEGQEILTDSGAMGTVPVVLKEIKGIEPIAPSGTAIAIDVGTTTVVVKLIDTGSGGELSVRAFANPQRVYGADVLSRINNAMDDASLLSELIRDAIDKAIGDILRERQACHCESRGSEGSDETTRPGFNADCNAAPEKIVIAGNTTMMYLLLGLRCRSLGLAPFEPEYALRPSYSYAEVFGAGTLSCPVRLYPYISAYVGGDIVSGIVNIERHLETEAEPSYMLVDMGTNGEIAYRNGTRLITTSTAAGPALEGGNITCGMSGLPGAIYETAYEGNGKFSYKTIGGKPALGICGSGVIDLMAKLLDAGLVSGSGAFTEEADRIARNAEKGPAQKELVITEAEGGEADAHAGGRIAFTQKDVREFQLAKGAIRAGIDILIEEMGEVPKAFYLAGGFGQNISLESAFSVGLIPRELSGRIRFIGNSSLGGCVDACMDGGPEAPLPALAIAAAAQEINLGAHKNFNNKFMDTMMFDEI